MSGNEGIREARVCPRHQEALFMPGYYSEPEGVKVCTSWGRDEAMWAAYFTLAALGVRRHFQHLEMGEV